MKKRGRPKITRCWQPEALTGKDFQEFCTWLNNWGDKDLHPEAKLHVQFRWGYEQAVADAFERLSVEWKQKKVAAPKDRSRNAPAKRRR